MNIVKFDPFYGLERITRNFDTLFNIPESKFVHKSFLPKTDISEDDLGFHLEMDAPGLDKENITITMNDDNILNISAEQKSEERENNRTYHISERYISSFSRSFALPNNAKKESILAELKNGVLHISIEKEAEVKPKLIEIN